MGDLHDAEAYRDMELKRDELDGVLPPGESERREALRKELAAQIRQSRMGRQDADAVSWGLEEGILLSRREAELAFAALSPSAPGPADLVAAYNRQAVTIDRLSAEVERLRASSAGTEEGSEREDSHLAAYLLVESGRVPDPRFADLRDIDIREVLNRPARTEPWPDPVPLTNQQVRDILSAYRRASTPSGEPEPSP